MTAAQGIPLPHQAFPSSSVAGNVLLCKRPRCDAGQKTLALGFDLQLQRHKSPLQIIKEDVTTSLSFSIKFLAVSGSYIYRRFFCLKYIINKLTMWEISNMYKSFSLSQASVVFITENNFVICRL